MRASVAPSNGCYRGDVLFSFATSSLPVMTHVAVSIIPCDLILAPGAANNDDHW